MNNKGLSDFLRWLYIPRQFLSGSLLEYVAVASVLLIMATIITNGVLLSFGSRIFTSAIGDATSGFAWLMYADTDWNPFWGHTNLVNFPYGQDLWSPVYVTWTFVMLPMWLLSKFMSPISALNVMTILGYVSTGLIGYWLVKKLTNRWEIAFFAAYGAAFMPYHVMKSSDHLTNVFSWVFVAIIAAFIAFWRRPSKARGLLLALSIAASCYTDGYFIFISGVLLVALVLSTIFIDLIQRTPVKVIRDRFIKLMVVAIATIGLLLPMLYVQLTSSSEIQQDLGNARENVKLEVTYYAAKPIDFLLPPYKNPFVGDQDWYQKAYEIKNRRSNNAESTNYIGYVVFAFMTIGAWWAVKELLKARNKKQELDARIYILLSCLVAIPLVLVWMLPPVIHILGVGIKMPMGYLVDLAPLWRVPSRAFLALQPLTIIAASLGVWLLINKLAMGARKKEVVLVLILTALLAAEFASGVNRPSFSTEKMPTTYSWLKSQEDIKSIAEVPVVDRPIEVAGYYVFAQMIHGKPIINTSLSKTAIGLYNPLGDINNPETVNFIKARGVDSVITHEVKCEQKEWGRLIHSESGTLPPPYTGTFRTNTCVYRLNDKKPTDRLFVFAKEGFAKTDFMDKSGDYWVAANQGRVTIQSTDESGKPSPSGSALFQADLGTLGEFTKKSLSWSVTQGGQIVASGEGSAIQAGIDTGRPFSIELKVNGNESPAPGELGFRNMQLIAR